MSEWRGLGKQKRKGRGCSKRGKRQKRKATENEWAARQVEKAPTLRTCSLVVVTTCHTAEVGRGHGEVSEETQVKLKVQTGRMSK